MYVASAIALSLSGSVQGMSYLYPPPSQKVNNVWKDGPCAIRAWVRAADLRQNETTHGEIRIRLEQPCKERVEHVALRLELSEFMEVTTALSPEIPMDYPSWMTSEQSDWKTHRHSRIAFTAQDLLSGLGPRELEALNSPAGLVRPFSVAMPDVRFPTGLFPLAFHATPVPQDDRMTGLFGRGYRYLASVTFANGSREESSAGFTTFIPTPPTTVGSSGSPVSIEVLAHGRRQLDDDEPSPCSFVSSEEELPLSLHFHNGRVVTPGASISFDLATNSLDDTHTALRSAYVSTSLTSSDGQVWDTYFNDLRTPYVVSSDRGHLNTALSPRISVSVPIPAHFPTDASSGAHFAVGAQLYLEIERTYGISSLQPQYLTEGDFLPEDYEDGADGWAYGECDRQYHRTRRFSASIPLEFPPSSGSPHYLSDEGHILPRLSLHPEHPTNHVRGQWERAHPIVHEDETSGTRGLPGFPWAVDDIQGFFGVFVGPVWEKTLRARNAGTVETDAAQSGLTK